MAPVDVKTDPNVKPRQQRLRKVAFHLKEDVKDYLTEMEKEGVITKLSPEHDHADGWVSNIVITKLK